MFKNVASQKLIVFAFDSTTNAPKTGDAANITAYVSKDFGAVTVLGDTTATEMDATNAKGYYLFDLTQAETNGDTLLFSAKSSTANIVVVGAPATVYTYPTTGILAPATSGRTLVVDASGLADANMVKAGPSGSGTAQTARDLGASVLLSSGTGTGQVSLSSGLVSLASAQTFNMTGNITGNVSGSVGSVTAGVTIDTTNRPGIRKNTALSNFEILMTDSTNHNPATGLTVSVTRSIDGGAFAAGTLGTVTAVSNGIYKFDFGAGDLNGDVITVRATATGADDLFFTIKTSP